ncbi:hypothetical protein BOTBODRAFT_145896 [Botryobasidium botryosum FD-172 SS1]|uniref:Uncharacterized protein n=1 Tax=Botryobasidium botryosum (strain FD-172 SS1) TaxID=930990 RepID=A0A067ME20_BOTB1|nr:hypothetical protein BOTBODRAFT_145896 [Botryobasidium botryosum FD-172 SS1]
MSGCPIPQWKNAYIIQDERDYEHSNDAFLISRTTDERSSREAQNRIFGERSLGGFDAKQDKYLLLALQTSLERHGPPDTKATSVGNFRARRTTKYHLKLQMQDIARINAARKTTHKSRDNSDDEEGSDEEGSADDEHDQVDSTEDSVHEAISTPAVTTAGTLALDLVTGKAETIPPPRNHGSAPAPASASAPSLAPLAPSSPTIMRPFGPMTITTASAYSYYLWSSSSRLPSIPPLAVSHTRMDIRRW